MREKPAKTETVTQTAQAPPRRKMRVDAGRNRESLIIAAKELFAEKGAEASLEEIARRAGVGIGTLYRNFSTRDEMVVSVYRLELAYLADSAKNFADLHTPATALHEWLRLFVRYIAAKKILASALSSPLNGGPELAATSQTQILDAITLLVRRAVAGKEIRSDIEPGDLLMAIANFTCGTNASQWERSANRLIDLLMDGLQSRVAKSTS